MKPLLLNINKEYNRNKFISLPDIRNFSERNNNSCNISYTNNNKSSNSINQSTKASFSKNNSSIFLLKNRVKKLKKIKLNNSVSSISSIDDIKYYFPKTNTNKNIKKLLKNADEIIKIRKSSSNLVMQGGKNFSKYYNISQGKEISKTNYSIKFLRKQRNEISLKNYSMAQALKNFNIIFNKDYRDFSDFMSIKEEDLLGKAKKRREETELILKQEQFLNESLQNQIKYSIKIFFELQKFGAFFHELIGTPFIYNKVPNKISKKFDYEDIANIAIKLYEKEDIYNTLPDKLNDTGIFFKKHLQMEDMTLYGINEKKSLEIEYKNDIKAHNKDLEQIKQSKDQYESDLKFFEEEKASIELALKKNKIYTYLSLDDVLNFIVELGIDIGVKGDLPKKKGKDFEEYIHYTKKIFNELEKIELEINKYIDIIEQIVQKEKNLRHNIIKEIIANQKNSNKLDSRLSFQQIQEKLKMEKALKTFEKARKLIMKGRSAYKYPNVKHAKKIKRIIIKEENYDEQLYYSDTEKEEEKNK